MGLRPLMIAGVFWVPAVLVMASLLPMRRAIIAAYVAGWLLLPVDRIALPGFTDINKVALINLSVLLAILLFHSHNPAVTSCTRVARVAQTLIPGWHTAHAAIAAAAVVGPIVSLRCSNANFYPLWLL